MISGLRRIHAFSLVEVTLALGIAAFCLIAVFGLMPIGVQTNRNATSQTAATNIMVSVLSDLRAAPVPRPTPGATASSLYGITIPATGTSNTTAQILYFDGAGQFATSLTPPSPTPFQPRYQLSVTFPTPAPGGALTPIPPTYADLKITWPAAAAPENASGSVEMCAALDRN